MRNTLNSWWAQALQNRLIALVLAMIVVVPLVATPVDGSLTGFAALTFEGFGILLLATLLWRTRWDLRKERVLAFLRTGANLPVLLFLGLAILSCLLSPYKAQSAQEVLRIGAGVLLYFVVAYQFRRSEHLSKLVDTLIFVTVGASLVGFVQYSVSAEQRAVGMFGNDQLLGSFLMILLPIIAVIAITEKTTNRQLAAQVATVLATACLLLAHSRSAWVGAASGLVVLSLLAILTSARKGKWAARKHEFVLPVMLLVISSGLFLILWPQAGSIFQRAGTLSQVSTDSTWMQRQQYWNGTLQMIREHPWTGVGVGTYAIHQQAYTGRGISTDWMMEGRRASLGENAHNFYLQLTAELGLPGLFLMLAVLATFLIAGLRRVKEMDPGIRRCLLMGAMASTVAFMADAIASPSWQLGQISMFLWLILGMGVGCLRQVSAQRESAPEAVIPMRFSRPATVLAGLALAAMLPTIVYAGGPGYAIPRVASLTPLYAQILSGQGRSYVLKVWFSDGTTHTVTSSPNASYSQTGGAGSMNNNVYQSLLGEKDSVFVQASYSQNGNTVQAHAHLLVH